MSTEAELRRIWGANYPKRIQEARDSFRALSSDSRAKIDEDNLRHIQALADMKSEAYTNSRHPDHQRVSQSINGVFSEIHFADTIII